MAVPKAYLAAVSAASTKYNVPAELLAAQIQAESGWNPNAKSPAGATGISQFMPGTAAGFKIDPTNPFQSIDAQGKMMGRLIKQYGGNQDKALAAYNAGAGNVAKYGGIPPFRETHDYINRIHGYESNYPGLKAGNVPGGLSPATVNRAAHYASMVGIDSTGSQKPPKGTSAGIDAAVPTNPYDAAQALTGYLIRQSQPGHGAQDPTGELIGLLSAEQQATQNVMTKPRGSKSVPVTPTVTSDGTAPAYPGALLGIKGTYMGGVKDHMARAIGNWESDNAIDVGAPVGTPVYAIADGTIGSQIGGLNSKDPKMQGQRLHLMFKGNEAYYAHLSKLSVKAGQKVKKGDLLGYSGSANGANHLHFSVRNGDPSAYYKK